MNQRLPLVSANFTEKALFSSHPGAPTNSKKINVSPNFLIHRSPVEWLHFGHSDGAENYWRIAKLI
jgi:hypothetical protein